MTLPHLVLASASPRRRELLQSFRIKLTIHPTDVDESFLWHKDNVETGTTQLALEKTKEAQKAYPSSVILGADTVVVLHDEILCKPKDRGLLICFSTLKPWPLSLISTEMLVAV